MPQITACFTTVQFPHYPHEGAIAVAIDVLRASSSICTAFMNGASQVIPVSSIDELRGFAGKCVIAAEKDGVKYDFSDIGNSPSYFTRELVEGRIVAYCSTNGTHTVNLAAQCYQAVVGSYLNISALCRWLTAENRDVLLLCAGWKGRFALEDAVFAGAVANILIDSGKFGTRCDSVVAAIDLWRAAKDNPAKYIMKGAQQERLRKINADDTIPYCHTADLTDIVPLYDGGTLKGIKC